jgi:glutaredoxin 3
MLKQIQKILFSRDDKPASVETVNEILMYTTRFCPYCIRAKMLFDAKGWAYRDIAVDADRQLRSEMMEKSGRHTVPQIWIGERHVGGCDDLYRLEVGGELETLVMGTGNE